MKFSVFVAMSLDGYIAGKNGGLDWLNPFQEGNEDYGYQDFISTMDCIVMGRNTFETVLSFSEWPYTIPVIVLSKSLNPKPGSLSRKTTVFNRSLTELKDYLIQQNYQSIYIDGGKCIDSFLEIHCIDEIIVNIIPVLLGSGTLLFQNRDYPIQLQEIGSQTYTNGIIQIKYKINP